MYESHDVSEVRGWAKELIKRGYFLVIVRLVNNRRLLDWCGRN